MPKVRGTKEEVKKEVIDHNVEVLRAKEHKGIFFIDLKINGVAIYGCRFLQNNNSKDWFVAFPARKDNEGNYWHHAYCELSKKDVEEIDKQIDTLLG